MGCRLKPAALRLLQHIEHSCRQLPSTQEAYRIMHFDTQAHRILYDTPIFVALSPDQSHNLLTTRFLWSQFRWCGHDGFVLNIYFKDCLPTMLENTMPATGALASIDGFRTAVLLTFEHLFGMPLVCRNCPD